MVELTGVLAAALTPFHRGSQKVDFDRFRRQIDWLVDHAGADAVILCGAETQEYQVLDESDRDDMVRLGIEMIGGRVPAVVGVTHPSLSRSFGLIDKAADAGAVVVLALAPRKPWGAPLTTGELQTYYLALAQQSPLPLLVYTNPRVGTDLTVEQVVGLAELDGVSYFKETSRDMGKIGRCLEVVDRPRLARYFTTMEVLLPTLLLGGPGAMMPPPAVLPAAAMIKAYDDGDIARAIELQRRFARFPGEWMHLGLAPVMKAAMGAAGIDVGPPVTPYEPLDAVSTKEVESFVVEELLRGL